MILINGMQRLAGPDKTKGYGEQTYEAFFGPTDYSLNIGIFMLFV
ncbi:MAG: hypothetical protein ACLUDU_01285 [Butyricimonas faecihominis]